MPSICKPKA